MHPDDIVVRGGSLPWEAVLATVETCFVRHGVHGLSVCAGPGLDLNSLYESPLLRRYPHYRVCTAGRLIELGFTLIPTSDVPHYTLDLGRELDEQLWEVLQDAFRQTGIAP